MKRKKCKRCGKAKDMPYHTCGPRQGAGKGKTISAKEVCSILDSIIEKPDPVQLGEELSEYISLRWVKLPQAAKDAVDITLADHHNAVYSSLMLRWERDFWRSKCLGV